MRIYPPFKTEEIHISNYVHFMKLLSEMVLGHEDAVSEKVIFTGKLKLERFRLRSAQMPNTTYPSFIKGKFNKSRDLLIVGYDSNLKGKLLLVVGFLMSILILKNYTLESEITPWSIITLLWFPGMIYLIFLIIHLIQIQQLRKDIDEIIQLAKKEPITQAAKN